MPQTPKTIKDRYHTCGFDKRPFTDVLPEDP